MSTAMSERLLRFVRTHLPSVWALELLLVLIQQADRDWTVDELVRQMRANAPLVSALLEQFKRDGLVTAGGAGTWRWGPAASELHQVSLEIADTYARTPFALIQAIAEGPSRSVMDFAEAFRLRDRDKKP